MVTVADEPATFGQKLKAIRLTRGLTQTELGDAAGLAQTVIARMERDAVASPQLDTLIKLADALGVSLDDFRPTQHRPQGKFK